MAKKQTRRSVSIRGTTYDTVRGYCEQHGLSMSEFVEDRIAGFFAADGVPVVVKAVKAAPPPSPKPKPLAETRPPKKPPAPRPKRSPAQPSAQLDSHELQEAARHFTF